jgi:hypothetical protein
MAEENVETETIAMPEAGCVILRHTVRIDDWTYFVHHYQEGPPPEVVLAALQEDALIKAQLRRGEQTVCEP